MHINYKAQFSNRTATRGHKKAAAGHDRNADHAIDLLSDDDPSDDEEDHSPAQPSSSARRHRHKSSGEGSRVGREGKTSAQIGVWRQHNGHKVWRCFRACFLFADSFCLNEAKD